LDKKLEITKNMVIEILKTIVEKFVLI